MRELLRDRKNAVETVRLIREGWDLGVAVHEKIKARKAKSIYTIFIDEVNNPALYEHALAWLAGQVPATEARRLELVNHRQQAKFLYNSDKAHFIKIEGHLIKVYIDSGNGPPKSGSNIGLLAEGETGRSAWGFRKLMFEARNEAACAAAKRFLTEIVEDSERAPSRMYTPTGYGWKFMSPVYDRPAESVVLRAGVMETLLGDIDKFRAEEQRYADLGIPWHRGYLFHGPPGTGKTSVAQTIAAYMGTDVYLLSLSGIEDDRKLYDLASDIRKGGAVVIIEDFDTVRASSDRSVDKGVTMAGLLNFLDGTYTPAGMVSIMTTNHHENLDPALIRPGRADRIIEISYMNNEQFVRLCERFLGPNHNLPSVEGLNITPAEVVDIFKAHFDEPESAYGELVEFVTSRKTEWEQELD